MKKTQDPYPHFNESLASISSSGKQIGKPGENLVSDTQYSNLKGIRILLVEDNKVNQLVTKIEIKKWKGLLDIASNASTAFEYLQQKKYDVILMDIGLPDMDGFEATQHIRHHMPDDVRKVPVIAMTASALLCDQKKCLDAGMNDFISKPYKPQILYSKLVKWATGIELKEIDAKLLPTVIAHTQIEKLLDLTYLNDLMDGDEVGIEKVLRNYIEDILEATDAMKKNLNPANYKALIEIAHKTKTSVTLVGAHKAKELLHQIEAHCSKKTSARKITGVVEECITICLNTAMEARTLLQKMLVI